MAVKVQDICDFLEQFAPNDLAEDWDNVGLLVGRRSREVARIMTCLTITPESAREAVEKEVDLIVTHHPLPFHSLKRLTEESTPGVLLLDLIEAGVAVYSPHTAFDSAAAGINQLWAERLGLANVQPMLPSERMEGLGAGRFGSLRQPQSLQSLALRIKSDWKLEGIHVVGDRAAEITTVGLACGSAGSFLPAAIEANCDVLITGETTFHTCLEAKARGIAMLLTGHFGSERFGVEALAQSLQANFSEAEVWSSAEESDPVQWL